MSKKNYLFLLIPVLLITAFIVVNYKPLSLVLEYYNNTNGYINGTREIDMDYFIKKIENDINRGTYKQYMLDITDYYITSDFVYIVLDKLGLLESYFRGIQNKMYEQYMFVCIIKYGIHSRYNQKITEMIKYYPIEDMENFPAISINFIEKASNYSSLVQKLLIGHIFAVNISNSLCYIVVTRQGCTRKEYYFDKFIYNPYKYAENLYLSNIPMDDVRGAEVKRVYDEDTRPGLYRVIKYNIQEIENECRL